MEERKQSSLVEGSVFSSLIRFAVPVSGLLVWLILLAICFSLACFAWVRYRENAQQKVAG